MYYSDKPMSELIKLYFEKIGHLDLLGSDKIRFLKNGEMIQQNSKKLIKAHANKNNLENKILVDDQEDRI